jgi:hypothetical protein
MCVIFTSFWYLTVYEDIVWWNLKQIIIGLWIWNCGIIKEFLKNYLEINTKEPFIPFYFKQR